MKHNIKTTLMLVGIFLLAQFVGLAINAKYLDITKTSQTGHVTYGELPYGFEHPEIENRTLSFIPIVIGILVGTTLMLILIRFKQRKLWKIWFLIAIAMSLGLALSSFIPSSIAIFIAIIAAVWRIFKPNIFIHNLTEVFIYGGISLIISPIMNITSAIIMLIVISIYDAIAVWQTKHMVKLAEFQTNSKLFAGLYLSKKAYTKQTKPKKETTPQKDSHTPSTSSKKSHSAILGGGDIAFPLIFASVVMASLVSEGASLIFLKTALIPVFSAIALLFLLFIGKKGKYYPAMPFISAGCFLGWGIGLLF